MYEGTFKRLLAACMLNITTTYFVFLQAHFMYVLIFDIHNKISQ